MQSPKVSVCIPCHNAADYVEDAIASVLDQTWENLEVIVVDDGSTDSSREVLAEIHDDRIMILHRSFGNAAASRNEAFRHSTGSLIKFFDADDLMSDGLIAAQVERLQDRDDAVASCEWGRFYQHDPETYTANPEPVWQDLPAEEWLITAWTNARPMMQPGLFLIPRNILTTAGLWDESLTLIDDFEFFARVLTNTANVLFAPDERLLYRSGLGNSLSQRKSAHAVASASSSLFARNVSSTRTPIGSTGQGSLRQPSAGFCPHLLPEASRAAGKKWKREFRSWEEASSHQTVLLISNDSVGLPAGNWLEGFSTLLVDRTPICRPQNIS